MQKLNVILPLLLVFFSLQSNAQFDFDADTDTLGIPVSGCVIDENLELMAGIEITDNYGHTYGWTGIDGRYQVTLPTNIDTLIFSFVGMEELIVPLPKECNIIDVVLMYDVLYHTSIRKSEKDRLTRFNQIPQIFKDAHQKGIFSVPQPCYPLKFVSEREQLERIVREMKLEELKAQAYFKSLNLGDTVKIPYSIGSNSLDRDGNTNLIYYSIHAGLFKSCIIKGVVIDKNRKRRGYNIKYRVIDTDGCNYQNPVHGDKKMNVDEVFTYNMRTFKVVMTEF